jgi:hypothetical protein
MNVPAAGGRPGSIRRGTTGRSADRLTQRGFSFAVTEVEDDREVEKRMVFFDIEPDAFGWRWERSKDAGATWDLLWRIDYRRAEDA